MNVYDFDNTIYRGDATVDFYRFCLAKQPHLWRYVPRQAAAFLCGGIGTGDLTKAKEGFFVFLKGLKNREWMLQAFWAVHGRNMEGWYLARKKADDVVISASPEFLLKPICDRLGIRLLASPVDFATGRYHGKNCAGKEKVRRFLKAFPGESIDRFYSDSLSDRPMAALARESFLVRRGKLRPWPHKGRRRGICGFLT